jgi:hypothetical protein
VPRRATRRSHWDAAARTQGRSRDLGRDATTARHDAAIAKRDAAMQGATLRLLRIGLAPDEAIAW